jgi:DNA replication protein DnaC
MEEPKCNVCNDSGWRPVADRRFTPCECRIQRNKARLKTFARIPARYENCTIQNYEVMDVRQVFQLAKLAAQRFVNEYPVDVSGLLLMGDIGTGKTHLAVAIMQELIETKNIPCSFYPYTELLKMIQSSYSKESETTELELLRPVLDTEVLVLDDIGTMKPSEWVLDTVNFIINTRYNDNRTTIITTNYTEEELVNRVGPRVASRLRQVCRAINMKGPDFRELKRLEMTSRGTLLKGRHDRKK